jgi:predicted nucleic acid-binding Zn ribbon protein
MTLKSLNYVLEAVAKQPKWEKQREYHQLVQCWRKIVNDKVAQNTKPLYLQRQIFWVATPNSVWAQNLALQRYSLLKKLNQLVTKPVIDIRFSPARWYQKIPLDFYDTSSLSQHPSSIDFDLSSDPDISKPTSAQQAFLQWMETIKRRTPYLEECPICKSPTPEGELKRWQMCAFCITKGNF